jgi:hypothetical protein
MEVEDNRLIGRKQRIEIGIGQAMGMFVVRLQLEQVNYIDKSDLQIGESFAE